MDKKEDYDDVTISLEPTTRGAKRKEPGDEQSNGITKERKQQHPSSTHELGDEAKLNVQRHPSACRKANKLSFIYGNYNRYYGYRLNQALDEDPRLKFFDKNWFQGKDCLDVGCNAGYLTITVARKFLCKSMLGIDIDSGLVGKARKHLQIEATSLQRGKDNSLQVDQSGNLNHVISVQESRHMNTHDTGTEGASELSLHNMIISTNTQSELNGDELLRRVSFRAENFIETLESDTTYDTVLCLSITKWIHLNWGDKGLIRLFAKIMRLLRPGGILVLEPQPWKSYKNKQRVSQVAQRNFREVAIRPQHFPALLLDKIGFRSMEKVISEVPNSIKGFNRPIFLFYK